MEDEFELFREKSNHKLDNESIPPTQDTEIRINDLGNLKAKPVILVVDDDQHVREALQITLGKKYELILCKNGNEGIETVSSRVIAVILDIKMEGKNGFETFIEIKKKNLYLPIIFHSAYQDLKNPFEIMNDYRPFGYVIKEGEGKELLDTLESAVSYYLQIIKNAVLMKELEKSEKNYRDLVENSLDIIFSLDSEGRILSINQSVSRILKYSTNDIMNKKFIDLVFKSNSINEKFAQEKFQELLHSTDVLSFHCDLVTKFGEPKEMHLKLKYLSQNGGFVIFGSASAVEEDVLLRLCESESQVYKLENYLTQVDIVSQRLSAAVTKYCDIETTMNLKLCVRELLINSMEHGNLGISFEEKSQALANDSYIHILSERQKDPLNINKRITVIYSLTPEKIEVSITDEGNGFDHKKMLARSIDDSNSSSLGHGRGILMSKIFFDHIEYNEKGNSVFIVKKFLCVI